MTFGARYSTPCISRRRLDAAACSQPRQQPCGEGDALYAQLLERFPSDVWLRNSAALTYLDIADWATALWWIDTALELTMNDGDQVRLIDQLVDMRSRALAALGRSGDDNLGRRVAAFCAIAAIVVGGRR